MLKHSLLALSLGLFMAAANAAEPVMVLMQTSMGDIKLALDADKAPKSVANFVQYAKDKAYDGTVFHRVIQGFMIQGGGYDEQFTQRKTRAPIANEAKNGLKNVRGSVAMARTSDPNSATSQFFINHSDNAFLDYPGQDGWGYAVFGKVVGGKEIVDKIKGVKTGRKGFHDDVPMEDVVIEKAVVVS